MTIPAFQLGEQVDVLNAFKLPQLEEVIHTGTIERITFTAIGTPLYWISGLPVARSSRVLRAKGQ